MTGLLVVMFGEPILSREPFIMIIMFQMSLILPKLIVWHDSKMRKRRSSVLLVEQERKCRGEIGVER